MLEKIYWAVEKVRLFSPVTKEKSTLVAIAGYARPDGYGSIATYEAIARDTGHDVRTIRRHVKALVLRGELVTSCDLSRSHRSNKFFIPIVARTLEDLLKQRQLQGLPLFFQPTRDNLSQGEGQKDPGAGTECPSNINDNMDLTKEGTGFKLKTKKERSLRSAEQLEKLSQPPPPLAPETHQMVQELLEGMRPVYVQPQTQIVHPEANESAFTQQEWEESLVETKKLLDQLRYGK